MEIETIIDKINMGKNYKLFKERCEIGDCFTGIFKHEMSDINKEIIAQIIPSRNEGKAVKVLYHRRGSRDDGECNFSFSRFVDDFILVDKVFLEDDKFILKGI